MKHRVAGRRLDRTTEHRTAMFKNMVTSLLRHERIVTTTPKAKELRRIADRVITLGKQGTPHARRRAFRSVRDVEVLDKLFGSIADRFQARAGGYTRLVRVARRAGDAAELSVIELTDRAPAESPGKGQGGEKAAEKAKAAGKKAAKEAPPKKEKAAAEKKPEKKPEKKAAKKSG